MFWINIFCLLLAITMLAIHSIGNRLATTQPNGDVHYHQRRQHSTSKTSKMVRKNHLQCADLIPTTTATATTSGGIGATAAASRRRKVKWTIKSISAYRDEILLLYGLRDEPRDVMFVRFRLPAASQLDHRRSPLHGVWFDRPAHRIEHRPLRRFLPGVSRYLDAGNEIVSLLRLSDQLVIVFLRDRARNEIFYLTYGLQANHTMLEQGLIIDADGRRSSSIMLAHINDSRTTSGGLRRSTYFIDLQDPSYRPGGFRLSNGKLRIVPYGVRFARLIGTNGNYSSYAYLVKRRSQSFKYHDFAPLSIRVDIAEWRALQFGDYIYVLTGIGDSIFDSGRRNLPPSVLYFKPFNVSAITGTADFTVKIPISSMSYARFFDCPPFRDAEPMFPPDAPVIHGGFTSSFFFNGLMLLIGANVVLCTICVCHYSPLHAEAARYPTIDTKRVPKPVPIDGGRINTCSRSAPETEILFASSCKASYSDEYSEKNQIK